METRFLIALRIRLLIRSGTEHALPQGRSGGGIACPRIKDVEMGVDTFGEKKVEPEVIMGSRYVNDHIVELVRDAFNEKGMAGKGTRV